MAQADAEKFLETVDKDPNLRSKVAEMSHFVELGKSHGMDFTNEELRNALESKWGKPQNRSEHPDPYTCCCFSEAPGF